MDGREVRVGCTNSVVDWICPICSEIVFMRPTGESACGSAGVGVEQDGELARPRTLALIDLDEAATPGRVAQGPAELAPYLRVRGAADLGHQHDACLAGH
jgi:hypothetical protein